MYSRVRRRARPVTRCRTSQVRLCRLFSDSILDLRVAGRPRAPGGHNDPFADIAGGAKSPLESQNCTRFLNRPISTVLTPPLTLPAERDVMSLGNQRIRRVYAALTGDNPTESEWWKDWLDSRQDRHDVAHRGEQMTRAKADKAIALADRYIQHLTEKVA